jgi:hypothetical protein
MYSRADFSNARWCNWGGSSCRPATADELRRYGHNSFTGALQP